MTQISIAEGGTVYLHVAICDGDKPLAPKAQCRFSLDVGKKRLENTKALTLVSDEAGTADTFIVFHRGREAARGPVDMAYTIDAGTKITIGIGMLTIGLNRITVE